MNPALRNLQFLLRRHRQTGCDIDYLLKLNSTQLEWLEQFVRNFYDGADRDPVQRRTANHRRYMSKGGDCMAYRSLAKPVDPTDNLSPEKIILLGEAVDLP